MDFNKIFFLRFLSRLGNVFCKHVMLSFADHFQVWKWLWKMTFFGRHTPIKNSREYAPPPLRMLPKIYFSYDYYLRCSMCDRCRKGLGEEGKETMICNDWAEKQRNTYLFLLLLLFSTPSLPFLRLPHNAREGGYLRKSWVGMCCWDHGTLSLYQS